MTATTKIKQLKSDLTNITKSIDIYMKNLKEFSKDYSYIKIKPRDFTSKIKDIKNNINEIKKDINYYNDSIKNLDKYDNIIDNFVRYTINRYIDTNLSEVKTFLTKEKKYYKLFRMNKVYFDSKWEYRNSDLEHVLQYYLNELESRFKENGYEIFYFPYGYGKQIEKESFYCKLINDKGGKMLKLDSRFKNRLNTYSRNKSYIVRKKCDFVLGEEVNIVVDNEIVSQAQIVRIDKFDDYKFYHDIMYRGVINQALYFKYKDKNVVYINSYDSPVEHSKFKALGFDIIPTTKRYFDSEYTIHNADGMKEYYDNYFKGDKSGYLIKFVLTRCY
jgi:hypothetical protein